MPRRIPMNEQFPTSANTPVQSGIAADALAHAFHLFETRQDARLVFHNDKFVTTTAAVAADIAGALHFTATQQEVVQLAAIFLHTGYWYDYRRRAEQSEVVARQFLEEKNYPPTLISQVLACIQTAAMGSAPATPEAQVLTDAAHAATYLSETSDRGALLRLERELMLGNNYSRANWAGQYLQQLVQIKWHTPYARSKYEAALHKALLVQRRIQEKAAGDTAAFKHQPERPFEGLEEDYPLRAVQTFFRTNYRNHINLSAIADNKANIMISVNSILISVLITALSYRNMAQTNPGVLLPVVIFLVTGLASLIFAVLSARPKVTTLNRQVTDKSVLRRNMVFFGNFVTLDLDQYEELMDDLFRNGELLYGNMVRDLYYLGQVLDKKYRYLSISYNVFMLGFIATVGTFLFMLFR
ncbi:MAG: hypothetical protein JNK77_15635 [Saprospiraceae bacterium]|nr:hypothetical protein [Saprospiraceae bacterium]